MKNQLQNQSGESYFKTIEDKIHLLQEQLEKVKINNSRFQQPIEHDATSTMDTLTKYLNNSKIYIVFMGQLYSGKSTFINALLGQKLLPSKNQSSTSQVVEIGHQNTNANQNTNISINEQSFITLKDASEWLTKMRNNQKMDKINIKTQSYFHETLSNDLQNRVFFIDTPGIESVHCSEIDYVQQIEKINQQIVLDEYSLRIDVWISDYTTLDREKQIQKRIISSLKSKVQQSQYKQYQNQENSQFLFIINKFDQRKESQDNPIEMIYEDIKQICEPDNIFKISAWNALNYNIMNSSKQENKERFISQFFENNQACLGLENLDDARDYCERRIKNNHKLIQSQDFNEFISKISALNGLFNDLNQKIILLQNRKRIQNAKQSLTQSQRDQVDKQLKTFPQKQIFYEQQLQQLMNIFFNSISDLIILAQQEIQINDPKTVMKKTCQKAFVQFHKLNQQLLHKAFKQNVQFIDLLKFELQNYINQEELLTNICKLCEQIFEQFMENHIFEYQMQSFSKYATELDSKMGIYVCKSQQQDMSYSLSLNFGFRTLSFDLPSLNSNLIKWKLSLEQQIKYLVDNYIKIHAEIKVVISQFIQEFIN